MSEQCFISICIPAYKRIVDLEKLLDSISNQTYKNFEVIITDDSPDNTVEDFCYAYPCQFKLVYYRNSIPLGTPENWNEAIRRSTGDWVKLMHDDDYFANDESLEIYVQQIKRHSKAEVFYSAFVFEDVKNKSKKVISCNWYDRFFLKLSPYHMLRRNYFGNPSCIIIKKSVTYLYDNRFKYIVDFAYYITLLKNNIFYAYIPKVLIHVGINDEQVTNYTYKSKSVQMYENHILFEKIGVNALRNIIAYDYFWRIYRNFAIKSKEDIQPYYSGEINEALVNIFTFQKSLTPALLNIGLFSKLFMFISYCRFRFFTKHIH